MSNLLVLLLLVAACPTSWCHFNWMKHVQLVLQLLDAECPTCAAFIGCSASNLCYYYWIQHVQSVPLLLKAAGPSNWCYYYLDAACPTCATIFGCSVSQWCCCYWMQHAQLTIIGCSVPNLLVILDMACPAYSPWHIPTHYWMGVSNYEAIRWSVDMCLSGSDGQPVITACCIVQQ